jgi:diaminopimelate decarboxylase
MQAASMSSAYNSRPLAPEILVEGNTHRCIRRRQSIEALMALENPEPARQSGSTIRAT